MPKSKRRSRRRNTDSQSSGETALLVVDQAPFLKKALSTCKRLRNELHKKQKLLADFEEHDRTAYWQWYNATHGAQLSKLRAGRDEVAEYEFILYHLDNALHFDLSSVPALYKELMRRKKDGTLHAYEPPQREEEDEDDWDDEDDDWDEDDDDLEEAAKRFFEEMFGGGGRGQAEPGLHQSREKPADDARLKTCYRNLAKRLHPDRSDLEESIREKRWHEIQDAYHNGDLEALLRVEAVCDMEDTGLSLKLGLARLRELAAYHKSHLLPLRNALRSAKKDIAFGFAAKGATPAVKREVSEELGYQREELAHQLDVLKYSVKSLYDEVRVHIREREAYAAEVAQCNARLKQRPAAKKAKPAKQTAAEREAEEVRASRAAREAEAARAAASAEKAKAAKAAKEAAAHDPNQMSFF